MLLMSTLTRKTTVCSGTKDARESALQQMKSMIQVPRNSTLPMSSVMREDVGFAHAMVAEALTKSSWGRNKSWAQKFMCYVEQHCGTIRAAHGLGPFLLSTQVPMAFLAHVARDSAGATTRVDAAKRALNFLRAMIGAASLDCDPLVKLLAKAARNAEVRTIRQSPALPEIFVKAIVARWGSHTEWWCRQITLMIVLGICTLGRGAEIVSCRRHGVVWVRRDGSQVREPGFVPPSLHLSRFSGVLLLFPSRKNKQASPSWIPVVSRLALRLLSHHLLWLDQSRRSYCGPSHDDPSLFPARRARRHNRVRVYHPAEAPNTAMSVDSFRALLRQALIDCCRIPPHQAKEFGTHSLRIAAVEFLRAKGVPADLRQQLGGWMSSSSALRYLQLPVNAQFSILQRIFG